MNKSFLRMALIAGIFFIPFISLVYTSSLAFPFVTGKAFAFRLLIELLAGIWVLLMLADKKYRPAFTWLSMAILAFLAVITVADIFGANPLKSLMGNFERMDGLINMLHLMAYFVIAGTVIDTTKLWERLFNTTIGVSVVLSLIGLIQLGGGIDVHTVMGRLDSTLGNATYFAAYLLIHVFLAIYMSVKSSGKKRYVYVAVALFETVILYFTATRSAMLGLIGGLFVIAILWTIYAREQKRLRMIAITAGAVLIIVIAGFVAVRNQPFIQNNLILNRFNAISIQALKDQTRYYLWTAAVQGIKEHPVLGWGQENFNLIFNKYYSPTLYSAEPNFDRAHNIILDWLTQAGLLGLVAYVSICATALYCIWTKRNDRWSVVEKSVLTGLFAGYLINDLFMFDTITSYILFFTLLAYIYSETRIHSNEIVAPAAVRHEMKKERKKESERRTLIGAFMVPTAIVVLCTMYFLNVPGLLAAYRFKQAYAADGTLTPDGLNRFKDALSQRSFGTEEIRQQMSSDAVSAKTSSYFDVTSRQEFFDLASSEMDTQIQSTPSDALDLYLLGSLLYTYDQPDKALAVLERARELSPERQMILSEIADVYIAQKDYANAYETAKMSYELEPGYDIARMTYAVAAALYGDKETAAKLMTGN